MKESFDYEMTLLKDEWVKDEIGSVILESTTETVVGASINTISKDEYYKASERGLKPDIRFILNKCEYNSEKRILFNNREYEVLRTGNTDKQDTMYLVCQEIQGQGD